MLARFCVMLCLALASLPSWAALVMGDFTLGMPRAQVMALLQQHYATVERVEGSYYQVSRTYYSAREPRQPYTLGRVEISGVDATFNEADQLRQLGMTLETLDAERVMQLIPLMRQAQPAPASKERLDAFVDEGELVYNVSRIFNWVSVTIADKPTSLQNIEARRVGDARFNALDKKMDKVIDLLKKQQGAGAQP